MFFKANGRPSMTRARYEVKLVSACATICATSLLTSLACGADQKPRQCELIVNVNTANFEELKTIPCVEDERATGIFKHRPYKTIDDLLNVPSIGPKILECMRPCIKVAGETGPPKEHGA